MSLSKKKVIIFSLIALLLIILIVLVLYVSNIKRINLDSENCNVNSDCVFYSKPCCYDCGWYSVNKEFVDTLDTEKFFSCFFTNFKGCPDIGCAQGFPMEPYCNENNKCDVRIDCEKICDVSFAGQKIKDECGCD